MSKIGRPRHGKEVKEQMSIRIEPRLKKLLIRYYGSVQNFLDMSLDKSLEPYGPKEDK